MSFTHASLFSGIGGFDLAAEWVGWKNVFHCEINEFCAQILKYHFPNADHYEDIKTTDFTKWRGKINVLSGGFPCQPFSLAGRRKGAEDDRYLWPQMLRAIQEIKPDWVVGENVAGIITMVQPGKAVELGCSATLFGEDYTDEEIQQQYVIETVCQDLEHSGYSIQPILVPACAVGAPHRRDRVWFVANRTDTGAEAVQQAGKNGICAVGVVTDTKCDGGSEIHNQTKSQQPERKGADCACGERDVADTHVKLPLYGNGKMSERLETERFPIGPSDFQTCWQAFPTQSPVCSGNDGLSARLDGITFPKWREESVKAYGNAIVPQVAYEIFKAIETINKNIRKEESNENRRY